MWNAQADKNGTKHVADIDERHPQALREKGMKLQERQLYRDAIRAYTDSLELDPKSVVTLMHRALCYNAMYDVK
jgi:hypothetical protein